MTENLINFQLILTTISDGIVVVDQRGAMFYANESPERLFERGELAGKIWPRPSIRRNPSRHQPHSPRGMGRAELRLAPIPPGTKQPAFVICVRDITERTNLTSFFIWGSPPQHPRSAKVTDSAQRIVRINPALLRDHRVQRG